MSAQNPFEKFTDDAKRALQNAEIFAKNLKVHSIGTELLLLALTHDDKCLAHNLLAKVGISVENIEKLLPTIHIEKKDESNSSLSLFAKEAIERSVEIARGLKHNFVGGEHILLALLRNKKCNANKILEKMSVVTSAFDQEISGFLKNMTPGKQKKPQDPFSNLLSNLSGAIGIMAPGNFMMMEDDDEPEYRKKRKKSQKNKGSKKGKNNKNDSFSDEEDRKNEELSAEEEYFLENEESNTPALDFFSEDFSKMAESGEIEEIIGRSKEIERVIHILNRKTKNNPVLIGEPGVGKTAIAEGLAKAIYEGKVPTGLVGKRVLSLDISAMIAGTKYRGEFEDRLKEVIDDAIDSEGEVIVFIDEMHTIIGAGSAEGTLDAANILKPALSRGKIQVIGATTFDEYRKYVEKDKALERRFQPVVVEEPSQKDAIEIMKGIKKSFEKFHRLKIEESAVVASVKLSKRFIPDRFLPDKAIDLLDEACAGQGHKSQKKSKEMKLLEEKLRKNNKNQEKAVTDQNYDKALKLKNKSEELREAIRNEQEEIPKNAPRVKITEKDIQKTVSQITGIPLEKLASDDAKKLVHLEDTLKKRVIGQEEAITEISKSIRRARAGISNPNRPMGTFLFLGPTGVGKTELVRVLTEEVFGKADNLVKIDMSEFMEKHSTSRLVGATAGYVGYEDGGELTEKVRRKPYSVVLFDEIEKAHTDFQNLLLQIFEDGFLTDAKGRKIDFRNTLIVMTSNIGADILTEEATKIGFTTSGSDLEKAEEDFSEKSNLVMDQVSKHFKPEFLGRLDTAVIFKPLSKDSIKKIVQINISELETRLKEKNLLLNYNDEVIEFLAEKSFDSKSGGRNVRKIVRIELEDRITDALLGGEISEKKGNNTIEISVENKKNTKNSKILQVKKQEQK